MDAVGVVEVVGSCNHIDLLPWVETLLDGRWDNLGWQVVEWVMVVEGDVGLNDKDERMRIENNYVRIDCDHLDLMSV